MAALGLPIIPPPLRPGSLLRIVAPSGPFDRALVLRGMAFLASRYRVEFDGALLRRHASFAGPDDRRQRELDAALSDQGVAGLVAARGGYGLTRILPGAPLDSLADSPRWIVGFSDITALHVEAMRLGVASVHGPHVTALGRSDLRAREHWIAALERPLEQRTLENLDGWHPGSAEGPLVGGNLTMLFTCAAAGRLGFPDGSILVIEDVTEMTYRIDRMLTALLTSGVLDPIAGVLVGEFLDCPAGRFGIPVEQVVRERLACLKVPMLAGLPVGHGSQNVPVPLGRLARMDADSGAVVFNPS